MPVDLIAVTAQFADIERADWPEESVDGITINCSDPRPRIFFRGDPDALRTRFTIAHELGHAVIPWHIGTAECAMPAAGFPRSLSEREADEFAAELLMPTDWLRRLIREHNADLDPVLVEVADARASATASMIALATALPRGWAFQMNNNPISFAHDFDRTLTRREVDRIASASGLVELHGQSVRWWRLFELHPVPELPADKDAAYGLFAQAHFACGDGNRSMTSIDGSVSSILGGLGGLFHFETAYSYLLWRQGALQTDPLYTSDDFRRWLAWKAFKGTTHLKTWLR